MEVDGDQVAEFKEGVLLELWLPMRSGFVVFDERAEHRDDLVELSAVVALQCCQGFLSTQQFTVL